MLVYQDESLVPIGYTDFDFQLDIESSIADSSMEAEYIAASEVAKEAVWLKNFLLDLGVVSSA